MDPYREAVNLSSIFTWDDGKTEDRAKVFTSPFFEGSSINNTELRDILTRNKMHGNTKYDLKQNDTFTSREVRTARDY